MGSITRISFFWRFAITISNAIFFFLMHQFLYHTLIYSSSFFFNIHIKYLIVCAPAHLAQPLLAHTRYAVGIISFFCVHPSLFPQTNKVLDITSHLHSVNEQFNNIFSRKLASFLSISSFVSSFDLPTTPVPFKVSQYRPLTYTNFTPLQDSGVWTSGHA